VSIGRVTLIVFTIATVFSIGLTSSIAYAMFLAPVEIIDSTGDGSGNTLDLPIGVATDSSGNVFVAGVISDNVFKITPGGTITEIINATGDGSGNTLNEPFDVATDSSGNVFVTARDSDNAFKISTPGTCSTSGTPCTITEIINATGDGSGNTIELPSEIATDSSGNVFVVGGISDNAFKITPGGTITEIINATGDGGGNILDAPLGVATDSSGNVFVVAQFSDNAFKISTPGTCKTSGTPCTITEIINATGDGSGNTIDRPFDVATDSSGNVFVVGSLSDNAFKISTPGTCKTSGTPCTITEIIDATGDGGGNTLDFPFGVATDSSGNVFVVGAVSDNAFKIAKDIVIGGISIPIDQSALLLAGVQSISMWMIPVVVAGIGIGIFVIKRRN